MRLKSSEKPSFKGIDRWISPSSIPFFSFSIQRYQGLKAEYEEETLDYSFSIREIVNQLEIIIQSRENDFPNLEEGLLHSFLSIAFEKIAFCNFCSCIPNFSEIYCNFFLRAFVVPNPYKCKGIYRNMI